MSGRCRMPGCREPLQPGQFPVFCATHHFQLPAKETAFLFRWQMKAARCSDDEIRQHMKEQLHGYINQAVRKLEERVAQ